MKITQSKTMLTQLVVYHYETSVTHCWLHDLLRCEAGGVVSFEA